MQTILLLLLTLTAQYPSETEWTIRNFTTYGNQHDIRLIDGSFVDILSDTEAFEVDWAYKWKEAVGQSLFYSIMTDRKPAIILLVKDLNKEKHYILRCKLVCQKYDIRLIVVDLDRE